MKLQAIVFVLVALASTVAGAAGSIDPVQVANCSRIKFQLGEVAMSYFPRTARTLSNTLSDINNRYANDNAITSNQVETKNGLKVTWGATPEESCSYGIPYYTNYMLFSDGTTCMYGYTQGYPDLKCSVSGQP